MCVDQNKDLTVRFPNEHASIGLETSQDVGTKRWTHENELRESHGTITGAIESSKPSQLYRSSTSSAPIQKIQNHS